MGVPPLSKSLGWTRGLAETRAQMFELQRQLATGKRAATYGGLGSERTLDLAMRARISTIASYRSTIQTTSLRTSVMVQVLDRVGSIVRETRSDASVPDYQLNNTSQTLLQTRAKAALEEMLALMRSDVGGRYLFAGRAVDSNPVSTYDEVMNGTGARAGFLQHLSERRQADLGADGLGRLVIAPPAGGDVTIAEDFDGSPFGFKLVELASSLTGTTATGPAGSPPEATLSFSATLPQPGETVRLALRLPDGTETRIELTAVAAGEGGAAGTFEIGADADTTAANFQTALTAAVQKSAATELSAASGYAASEDFFNFDSTNPPQRIDGPPFDTATALRDATATDTVFWYKGDAEPGDARATAVARVDTAISVSYGARANEEAFRWAIQNLAVLAAETFDANVETDKERYLTMTSRATANLSYTDNRQSIESIYAQIVSAQHVAGQADTRHKESNATAEGLLTMIEQADPNEAAIKLLQLQTRLEASYEVTSRLSQLSLVHYI